MLWRTAFRCFSFCQSAYLVYLLKRLIFYIGVGIFSSHCWCITTRLSELHPMASGLASDNPSGRSKLYATPHHFPTEPPVRDSKKNLFLSFQQRFIPVYDPEPVSASILHSIYRNHVSLLQWRCRHWHQRPCSCCHKWASEQHQRLRSTYTTQPTEPTLRLPG